MIDWWTEFGGLIKISDWYITLMPDWWTYQLFSENWSLDINLSCSIGEHILIYHNRLDDISIFHARIMDISIFHARLVDI